MITARVKMNGSNQNNEINQKMLANVFQNLSCDIKTIERDCDTRKFCQIAFRITFKRAGFIKTEIVHDYKSLNGKNMKYLISFKYSEPYNFEPIMVKIQAITNLV